MAPVGERRVRVRWVWRVAYWGFWSRVRGEVGENIFFNFFFARRSLVVVMFLKMDWRSQV